MFKSEWCFLWDQWNVSSLELPRLLAGGLSTYILEPETLQLTFLVTSDNWSVCIYTYILHIYENQHFDGVLSVFCASDSISNSTSSSNMISPVYLNEDLMILRCTHGRCVWAHVPSADWIARESSRYSRVHHAFGICEVLVLAALQFSLFLSIWIGM